MADMRMFWPITAACSMNARAVTDNRERTPAPFLPILDKPIVQHRSRHQSAACVSARLQSRSVLGKSAKHLPAVCLNRFLGWTGAIAGEKTIGRLFGLGRLAFSFGQHLLENTLH